jgi:glucosamine--fructose-6-phosphate aminotransferase (isomerizing)
MESAQQQGVPTIAITNTKDAPISAISDDTILMDVGDEKSVAASKTYTSQLTAVAMLAAYYSEDEQLITDLELLPEYTQAALDQWSAAQAISKSFATTNHAVIVGRGFNYCTTHEIALKIKELSYMIAQPYSAADFRHGPIAILEPGFPVLTIAMRGKALGDMESMIDEIRWTDANLAIMTNVDWLDHYSKNIIRLPEELPDWLSPIVCTIPGQILALHLALEKGLDPDKPRRLNKITLTY